MRSMIGLLVAAALLGGCAADPEMDRLMETLPVAATCGSAADLAVWLERDLDAASAVPESEKTELRARARILAAHGRALADAVERYDPAGKRNPSITMNNLRARQEALDEEHRMVFREWGVWQVAHGRRKAEEVSEIFDFAGAMR